MREHERSCSYPQNCNGSLSNSGGMDAVYTLDTVYIPVLELSFAWRSRLRVLKHAGYRGGGEDGKR